MSGAVKPTPALAGYPTIEERLEALRARPLPKNPGPIAKLRRSPAEVAAAVAVIDAKCQADLAAARATPGFRSTEERVASLRALYALPKET
jgi:hypothetical protein